MTACAALVFMLPPQQIKARVGLGITSLLVIVALHITLNTELPEINDPTRLDRADLVSYRFGFGSLVSVIRITRRHLHNLAGSAAHQANRRCGMVMCGSYLVLTAYLVLARSVEQRGRPDYRTNCAAPRVCVPPSRTEKSATPSPVTSPRTVVYPPPVTALT